MYQFCNSRLFKTVSLFLLIIVLQLAMFSYFPAYKQTICRDQLYLDEYRDEELRRETSGEVRKTSGVVRETSGEVPDWEKTLNFTGFDNETGTSDGHYIVPNYVHFVKFQHTTFSLVHMVCVLAAYKHQKPDKLFIHTDVDFHGKYWEVIVNTPGLKEVLVINKVDLPKEVFGQPLNSEWAVYHGADVVRVRVMRQFGGIYLDSDSYIIRNLNDLRRFEFVAAWKPGKAMMNQVVVAHKDARLLKEWYEGYKDYKSDMWYYNAGRHPANVLQANPHFIHSVPDLLGTYDSRNRIYVKEWPEWRSYYSVHLMIRWMTNFRGVKYPSVVEEVDVLKYDNTFRQMVLDVYDINKLKRRKP